MTLKERNCDRLYCHQTRLLSICLSEEQSYLKEQNGHACSRKQIYWPQMYHAVNDNGSFMGNCQLAVFSTVQCKPDISRLVGSMERYRDISGNVIYRATAMSQNPGQVVQRVVSGDGAFVCLAANSAGRQRISWHLSKFDVALQNCVAEFQTKAVCA